MKKKLLIYGAGNRGKNLCHILLNDAEYEIVAVIDGNPSLWGTKWMDKFEIESPDRLVEYSDAMICITIYNYVLIESVRETLFKKYGLLPENEVRYEKLIWEIFRQKMPDIEVMFEAKEKKIILEAYLGLGLDGIVAWQKRLGMGLLNRGYHNLRLMSDSKNYTLQEQIQSYIDVVSRENIYKDVEDTYNNYCALVDYYSKSLPCTLIINHHNVALMAASDVKRMYPDKMKLIVVIHSGMPENYVRHAWYNEYVDWYIGVSSAIKQGMIDAGVPEEKVKVMYCPCPCKQDLERTYTMDREMPIRIGYAGRLEEVVPMGKRMDLLLALVKELHNRGMSFQLELAGDGPGRIAMEEAVRKNGLDEKISFLGTLSAIEICEFWKRQDVCINLSDYEGRSLSIVEAMGNGAVPVVTDTSGVRDDISDGANGYIVPLGDYILAADRIQFLDQNREKLEVMGRAAHREVYPKSSMDKHIDFWESIV